MNINTQFIFDIILNFSKSSQTNFREEIINFYLDFS